MKAVMIETDPRPVEQVVTGEGGMEHRPDFRFDLTGFAKLFTAAPISTYRTPAYQRELLQTFSLRGACAPIIMPPRCRSVLTPIEGI
jgi:hypothetical protein